MCQEVQSIQDVVLYDSQQLSGSDFSPLDSPSPSPARSSFKSSSMNSLFGSLRGERSLPTNLSSGSQTVPSRRPVKLIPSLVPKLMFGTTPLAYKGSTTRIHLLTEPAQIMLTKTFSIHPNDIVAFNSASTRRGSFSSNTSSNTAEMSGLSGLSTVSGIGDFRSMSRASRPIPTFIPDPAYTRDDFRNGSISSSMPNSSSMRPRAARPGFSIRRLRRASQTSMENGTFNPTPLPSSFSHLDSMGNAKPALTQAAKSKSFSIAVFIDVSNNSRLREFIFSHFALIESRLHHLQALCLELLLPACRNRIMLAKGGISGSTRSIPDLSRLVFQQEIRLIEAVARFQQSLYELYSAPRIQSPLWLNMNTYPGKKAAYSASFMTELIHVMEESPSSAQLVSAAISAVLSHHMSWVPTIAPVDQPMNRDHPQGAYDPLWAQLSDLYGNIGTSSRISRTIVVGSSSSFVRRLLYILSYLIRCNEVFQLVTEIKDDPESLLNKPKPSRSPYDIHEDQENGSPATMMRAISIPKRPRIDTVLTRGSVSRLTSIGEPTTPTLPHHQSSHLPNDRIIPSSVPRRPLFDTTRPRMDTKDSLSTESTPYPSRPTTPTTIESKPDSDRASPEYSNGSYHHGTNGHHHHLRVDTMRSRTHSSDTLGTDASKSNKADSAHDSGCPPGQDVLMNVPLPVSRVVCSFPPFPSSPPLGCPAPGLLPTNTTNPVNGVQGGTTTGATTTEEKILPADVLFCKSYGRSLMAPYCDHYMPDFALMGVPKCDFLDPMEADMRDTMKHFEISERVASTVCIVADANTWKCNVFSARTQQPFETDRLHLSEGTVSMQSSVPSQFLDETLHQMVGLGRSGLTAELCLGYFEDRLLQLYQCSRLLSSMVRNKEMMKGRPTLDSMAPLLGLHRSDMTLVLSICSTYDDLVTRIFADL
ncbi:Folliculin-interacting protein 1 [Podila minutissima]|nr:Folliculin-interacting protein 1 [Podila minutissima]